jgi:hypothetical protein
MLKCPVGGTVVGASNKRCGKVPRLCDLLHRISHVHGYPYHEVMRIMAKKHVMLLSIPRSLYHTLPLRNSACDAFLQSHDLDTICAL